MLLAMTYVLGKHATWYGKVGWWLFGTVVFAAAVVGVYFLLRGVWRSGRKESQSSS